MSRRTISGWNALAAAIAPLPSAAVATTQPQDSINAAMLSRESSLSSSTSTRRPRAPSAAIGALVRSSLLDGGLDGSRTPSGRRTMNSLPSPSPRLRTSTLPSCSSAMRFTSVRPMPRPLPLALRATCMNGSKTCAKSSGAMPIPSSRTRTSCLRIDGAERNVDRRAWGAVAARVRQQVDDDLLDARRIDERDDRRAGLRERDALAVALEFRARRLDGVVEDLAQVDVLQPEVDVAARDARDVDQVVDDTRQHGGLALDHFMQPRDLGAVLRSVQQLERIGDRRERVAQLVAEHREELVLALILLAQQPLGALALGDVARRFEHQRHVVVGMRQRVHRVDDDPPAVARRLLLLAAPAAAGRQGASRAPRT